MPIYKDGKKYYYTVNYTTNAGEHKKYKSKRFDTKREAAEAEASYMLSINKVKNLAKLKIKQVADELLKEKEQQVKYQSYVVNKRCFGYICNQVGDIYLSDFSPANYEEFRDWLLSQEWSISHKNKINKMFKEIIKFANKKYGYSITFPFNYDNFKNPNAQIKKMEFYTKEQFEQYYAAIPAEDWVYASVFLYLFFTGNRLGEMNGLRFSDLQGNQVTISRTVSTKIKSPVGKYLISSPKTKSSYRTIPLTKRVLEAIKKLHDYYSQFEGFDEDWYIFGGLYPIAESTLTYKNVEYAKAAGLPHIKIHSFRHSFATYMVRMNCSLAVLSKYLGHSNLATTLNVYSHLWNSEFDDLIKIMDAEDAKIRT